jgi:DNA-binding beta-propeller fold protein YncE
VKVGPNPEFVRVRGHMAFVSYEPSSTGSSPTAPPSAAAKGDDDSHDPAHIAVIDLDKGRVVRSIRGGLETEGIEFAADGKHILITNEADNTIGVHEIATGKLVKTIDTKPWGNRPRGIKMAPDGKSYVATLEFSDAFIVLDEHYDVVKSVKTAGSPYGVAFDRAGKRLFVAAAKAKVLQVFDAATFAPIKDVATGGRCWHFSFTPDEATLLVACGRSGEIVAIDAATLEPVKHIADDQTPWGIVTWPKSQGSLDRAE